MAEKKKRGRPSTYKPEIAEQICERIAGGETLRQISRAEGFPPFATIISWVNLDIDGFSERYARARSVQIEHLEAEILDISDDGSNDWMDRQVGEETIQVVDHEHVQRSKLRVDSRKWLLSKLRPEKYGDRIHNEHSGNVGVDLIGRLQAGRKRALEDGK